MTAAIGAFVAVALLFPPARAWLRGEIDIAGNRVYEPAHPIDVAALRRIDLGRVHRELLPDWILAAAHNEREDVAYAALHEAVEGDDNLVDLVEALRDHVRGPGLADDPQRALYLAWAWSTYVDRAGYPFLLHGAVHSTRTGPVFSAVIYETHADAAVSVGVEDYRVRVGSRVDGMNVRELYLGAAGRDEAIIVVDRLREFATTDLWPLLEPALDELLPQRARFAPAIRAEARARLPAGAFEELQALAVPRFAIITTVVAIHERRDACGSGLKFNQVPWFGFEPDRIRRLRDIAERDDGQECPAITLEEVDALDKASARLLAAPELQAAVEAMVAWAAEHVAIHEARHLADDEHADGFDTPLHCRSCSEEMGIVARAELSGYLASIAWSPSPATALYQACRAVAEDRRLRGTKAVRGPHFEALSLLQRRLGPICGKGPPDDLSDLGRLLEHEMLERSDPMSLAEDFPRRLPVASPPPM